MNRVVQRHEARLRANEVRLGRAALKRELRAMSYVAGRRRVAGWLRDHAAGETPELLRRVPVIDLLGWPLQSGPRVAGAAARAGGARVASSSVLTVGELTAREALAVAESLDAQEYGEAQS